FSTPGQPAPGQGNAHPVDDDDVARGGSATCDCWVTPDASYTTINNNTQWNASGWGNGDDGSYGPINLPFGFYLYGQTYTVAYININGSISFGAGDYLSSSSSSAVPMNGPALVAPFWADVDLRGGGANVNQVQHKVTPAALHVNWTNGGNSHPQTDTLSSSQVVISDRSDPLVADGANLSFCYGTMEWTTGSASGGSNGLGRTPPTSGANKGDGGNYS